MRWWIVVVAGVVVSSCKPSHGDRERIDKIISELGAMVDAMCRCTDKACVDTVNGQMTAWGDSMAKQARPEDPDEARTKQLAELESRYSECMTKAFGAPTARAPTPIVTRDADAVLRDAFTHAAKDRPITTLVIEYVTADGMLDPTYGKLDLQTGQLHAPAPTDDPKRPLGAPPPPPAAVTEDCTDISIDHGQQQTYSIPCSTAEVPNHPRCSIRQVWKHAIAGGAPAQALARIVLFPPAEAPQHWVFNVDDEPRGVHFSVDVPDTCPVVVESSR